MSRKGTLRVGFDCRFVLDKPTGIGSYTLGLVRGLLERAEEVQLVLITGTPAPAALQHWLRHPRVEHVEVPLHPVGLRQKLLLRRYLAPLQLDVYHYPHYDIPFGFRSNGVITVHHFIDPRVSTGPGLAGRAGLFASMLVGLRQARRVIAVSRYTAERIRGLGLANGRVRVIYPPPSPVMTSGVSPAKLPPGVLAGRYFLSVAEWRPHKNLPLVLRAFASAREKLSGPWQLVLVGPDYGGRRGAVLKSWRQKLNGSLVVLDSADPPLLARLYREAAAAVLVSRVENFGYPVVEAMHWGCPVVVARSGSLPEVAGGAALLVSATGEGLPAALVRLARDSALRQRLIRAGKQRAREYLESAAVDRTLRVYREVAE